MGRAKRESSPEENGWTCVVAFDPGGTTGWSVMCVEPDSLVDPGVSVLKSILWWRHGQIHGPENSQADQMLELVSCWPGAAVVCESFQIRQFNQSQAFLSPVRLRAVLEWGIWKGYDAAGSDDVGIVHPSRPLFTQTPEQAKSTATDDRLKQWGLYVRKGGLEHARDADRHSITFLRRAKEKAALRQSAWPQHYAEAAEAAETLEEVNA